MTKDIFEPFDFDYAATVSNRAIEHMSQQRVPASPDNYSVWFAYALGTSPALRKTVDILLRNRRQFDTTTNRELFLKFISPDSALAIVDFPAQLADVIGDAKRFLNTAIADNATQIKALGTVSAQCDTEGDPKIIVEKLMAELARATLRANFLEKSFSETSDRLEKVRSSLEEAEIRSNTDALTGLANRRAMEEFVRNSQIESMETGQQLSVFMIDIDHFKKFNDTYGHQFGDQVIRLVASVLKDGLRASDMAARYGGEELIAILPGADLDVSRQVAERIRCRIAKARLTKRSSGAEIGTVTVSIGVAQFAFGESADAMIERCDRSLYQAKREGRNRTVTEIELSKHEPKRF